MRIGLFLRHLDEEFQITVFAGVRARARERGIDLLCVQTEPFQDWTNPADRPFALAQASGCDGFLVLSPVLSTISSVMNGALLDDLEPRVPVLSVGMKLLRLPSVVFRGDRALRRVVEHLILDHHYQRLLFIGGPEDHRDSRARLNVVRKTMGELEALQPGLSLDVIHAGFSEYSVRAVLRPLLSGEPFDAILAANDNMAIGALKLLKLEAGDRWASCAVTGFDDIPQAALCEPALTSVHQPLEQLGRRSFDALLELIQGNKTSRVGTIDCWPVLRESCGCPARTAAGSRALPWGPGQRQAAEAERWLRAANYLAGDLGMVESRAEAWLQLDAYLATVGLENLAILEDEGARSGARAITRLVFERRAGVQTELDPEGRECRLDVLLDSLNHPMAESWDYTVVPLRSGRQSSGLAVYSAPLSVHPYIGAVLPHVAHCLRRLHDMEDQKHRNLILEEMVQKRTRELVLANDQLRAQRRGLETILRTLPLPLALYRDSDRRVLYANPAFERVAGIDPVHASIDDFVRIPNPCDGMELSLVSQTGEAIPVLTYCVPIEFEDQSAILAAMVDLSRQRALESEVLQASEWERRRFGLELHDDICQRLAGIVMYLKGLQNRPGDWRQATGEVATMVDEALHLTRQYSHASFPIELERRGLVPALATLCESVESRTGRVCSLLVSFDPEVLERNPQRDLHVYRIVQEALHNAIKHGKAHRIEVSIHKDQGFWVRVSDDGQGMGDHPEGAEGLGLRSMAYRAAQIGAILRWDNHPGRGVVVTLEVP